MEKADFCNLFKSEIKIVQFSKETQKEIEDYLIGETDFLDVEASSRRLYTPIYSIIENQLNTDNHEIAKRALQIMFYLFPTDSFYRYRDNQKKYCFYEEIGLDKGIVWQDIIESMNESAKYYGNYLETQLKEWISSFRQQKETKHAWSQMLQYNESEVESILNSIKKEPKIQMAQLILTAICMEYYRQDETKYITYKEQLEEKIYEVFKQCYNEKTVNPIFDSYFTDPEIKEFYKKSKQGSIFYNTDILKKTLCILCRIFYQDSKFIAAVLKVFLIKTDGIEYMRKQNDSPEQMEETYRYFGFPYSFDVKLYAGLILEHTFEQQGEVYAKKCEDILEKEEKAFFDAYHSAKKDRNMRFIVMLAFLLKHKKLKAADLELEVAEKQILDKFLLSMQGNKGRKLPAIKFTYDGKQEENLDLLKEKTFEVKKASLRCEPYSNQYRMEVVASAALFSYSALAKNLMCLFIPCPAERNIGSNLNIFLTAQKIFSLEKKSTKEYFEILSDYCGVEQVIRSYVFYMRRGNYITAFRNFLKNHEEDAYAFTDTLIKENSQEIVEYINILYDEDLGFDLKRVVPALEHKMKTVINYMESFLAEKKEVREQVEALAKSKNKNTKDAIARLIRLWDSEKIAEELEKIQTPEELIQYIQANYDEKSTKQIPFYDVMDFGKVRFQNSDKKAPEILLHYYISEYMLIKDLHILKPCTVVSSFLNKNDLRMVMKELYQNWLEKGADTKLKNILLPFTLCCYDQDIAELKKQIDIWTENARGALAAFAVTAMAFNGGNLALMLTENISNKYKNKQVRGAAFVAMQTAADTLGITKEELADKIIPDLGFGKNRERIFDYGSRKFRAVLNNKLEIALSDETGKIIKNLPKPNASDNQEMAENCKEELKGLKKQLKTIVNTQKSRLETALITGRKWSKDQWLTLFVGNPIMHRFATGLIWAEKEKDGTLLGTFRYMEDGSFNTNEEEEYEFHENSDISLLHNMDIEQEEMKSWAEQLEDYEIVQPINQLSMPIYFLTEQEKKDKEILRFANKKVYFGTIRGVAEKYGWKRTSILDGGGYDGYYYEDEDSKIGIQISFEYIYVGMEANDTANMKKIEFYKKGTVDYGSYCYDEIDSNNRVMPKDVPEKLMSFALLVGDSIAQKEII